MHTDMSISHKLSNTTIYRIFHSMKGRCFNSKNQSYHNYGGRGITICDEWVKDVTKFIEWAIQNGWQKGLEIDRVDVNGNYCPENCRIVPRIINARNTRSNLNINFNGETKCLTEWCQQFDLNYNTVRARIFNNWGIEEAFSKPTKTGYTPHNLLRSGKSNPKRSGKSKETKTQMTAKQIRDLLIDLPDDLILSIWVDPKFEKFILKVVA